MPLEMFAVEWFNSFQSSFFRPPKNGHLNGWKWNFPGSQATYTALYPRAWTEYFIPECNIRLICRQISPVIPHNYKVLYFRLDTVYEKESKVCKMSRYLQDSSLPGGVFVWSVENNSNEYLRVTIAMCLKGYKGKILIILIIVNLIRTRFNVFFDEYRCNCCGTIQHR